MAAGLADEVTREAAAELGRNPGNAEGHYLSGRLAAARQDWPRARAALQRAVELAPGRADFHYDLGLALRALGEKRTALAAMERALELQHDHVPAAYHAGKLHAELGELEDARDCYGLALAFDPRSSASRVELARLLEASVGLEAARSVLEEAVAREIADAAVISELAVLAKREGDFARAGKLYESAMTRFPGNAAVAANLGLLRLAQFGDAVEAERLFRRALELDPGQIEAWANLDLALQEQGRFEEALAHCERAIRERPDVVEFRWNRGLAHLLLGRFGAAWEDYELRKGRPDAGGVHEKFTLPDWDGTPLAGRSILVYGEQGLGDEIMFASCLDEVIARAELTVVECDARLANLYRRAFPRARIEPRGPQRERDWRATYPSLELQAAVGSLPLYLRRDASDFPERSAYFKPDSEKTARWRLLLGALTPRRAVGISWRGGTPRTRGLLRSLRLDDLQPLLDAPGSTFVVLQRALSPEERSALSGRANVFIPEDLANLDEFAALLAALDLVVSADNSTVHLAGALGRPVWVLLSASPDWRYLWEGERMPWYPSARLLRQRDSRDWHSVVDECRSRLEHALA
jgi:tetratricopeptide (TPR) repeat protein